MKKLILLFVCALSLNSSAQIPDYFGLQQKWVGGSYEAIPNVNMTQYQTIYANYVNGDTVIGSVTYYKLYGTGNSSTSQNGQIISGSSYDSTFKYCLRQVNRKVYYYDFNDSIEKLWVDYGIAIGDTVKGKMAYNNMVVDSIDSILINNVTHRRLFLNKPPGFDVPNLVEGVGFFNDTTGDHGSFYYISPIGFGSGNLLKCYAQNDSTVYKRTIHECFYNAYIEGLSVKESNKNQIKIYPNPIENVINIESSENIIKIYIYNIQGQKIVEQKGNSLQTENIDLSTLTKGVYIIKLDYDNQHSLVKKVIKK